MKLILCAIICITQLCTISQLTAANGFFVDDINRGVPKPSIPSSSPDYADAKRKALDSGNSKSKNNSGSEDGLEKTNQNTKNPKGRASKDKAKDVLTNNVDEASNTTSNHEEKVETKSNKAALLGLGVAAGVLGYMVSKNNRSNDSNALSDVSTYYDSIYNQ